jgi:enamine deaminase RidA (YjgF/YER057c/UK114 family)
MGRMIQPAELPEPEGRVYSLGYVAGNTVWVAGQCAVDEKGQPMGLGDPRAQAECIFRRIEAILREAGAKIEDICFIRTYLTDMRYQPTVREVRKQFFGEHRPASTSVQVVALARPEYLMEIEVVATIGG